MVLGVAQIQRVSKQYVIVCGGAFKLVYHFLNQLLKRRLRNAGDNAIPAIWSFIEITVATICTCLPALRLLLARNYPKFFDIAADPSQPFNEDIYKRTPYSPASDNRPMATPSSERAGAIYSKRVILSPDDVFLQDLEAESEYRDKDRHLWMMSPRVDEQGNIVDVKRVPRDSMYGSIHDSSDTSMFALEGPRLSDNESLNEIAGTGVARKQNMWSLGLDFSRNSGISRDSGKWLSR